MAQSSIHIEAGHTGYLFHNDRSKPTSNSIFSDEKNEYSFNAQEALKLYKTELQKRAEAYTNRTNQKLQKKVITHLSAIVNLNKGHSLRDLEPLKEYLEQELDTKVFQIAIHKDEGYVNQKGKEKKNYHAHLEFLGLDSEGKSIRRKLTKKFLINLQDKVAEILGMQRGKNYTKTRTKRPKRLDTYEYKEHKKREAKLLSPYQEAIDIISDEAKKSGVEIKNPSNVKQFIQDLQEQQKEPVKESFVGKVLSVGKLKKEIQTLREELKEKNKELEQKNKQKVYTQADYTSLNKLKKELNKNNIEEIYEAFLNLKEELRKKDELTKTKDAEISMLREQLKSYAAPAPTPASKPETIVKVEEKIVYREDTSKIEELKDENKQLKSENKDLKDENARLQQLLQQLDLINSELIKTQKDLADLQAENADLQAENTRLKAENTEQPENTKQAKKKKKSKNQIGITL